MQTAFSLLFLAASLVAINLTGDDTPCGQCRSDCTLYQTLDPVACGNQCVSNGNCTSDTLDDYYTGKSTIKVAEHKETGPKADSQCPSGYSDKINLNSNSARGGIRKANIIMILLDDQDQMTSPFLDAMPFAKEFIYDIGVKFERTLSPSSVCCAARCQILTGLFGHNVGVTTNTGDYGGFGAFTHPLDIFGNRIKDENGKCINNEDRTVARSLKDSGGYATAIIGKYVNDFGGENTTHTSPGWTKFMINPNTALYGGYNYTLMKSGDEEPEITYYQYGYGDEDYSTDVIANESLDFIRSQRQANATEKRPLFMYVSATAPHLPLTPARRHEDMISYWEDKYDEVIGTDSGRENYFEEDIRDKASWLRLSGDNRMEMKDSDFMRSDFAKRMTSLMAVDDMIKNLAEEIRNNGEEDNTIWVLTSDNGYNLGAHRLIHKMAPYEESVRIPLMIRGIPGFESGITVQEQVALPDLAPTFIELANLKLPEYMDGRSLLPFLKPGCPHTKKTVPFPKRDIILEYGSHGGGETVPAQYQGIYQEIPGYILAAFTGSGIFTDVPAYHGIRTHDDKLFVRWYGVNNATKILNNFNLHEYELYHMKDDPFQLNNLARHPRYKKEVQQFSDRLNTLWQCKGKTC